ncbi:hypothetical protein ACHAPM_004772 [Fusarium culmorum]
MESVTTEYRGVYKGTHQTQKLTREPCLNRNDDGGIWNFLKAWYLFVIHIALSVTIVTIVIHIDKQEFRIGSGPNVFAFNSRLYQAQVTGLLSLALVTLRLVAGTGSALLAWRIVFILLEKRGITLKELTRLLSTRVPIIPATKSEISILWSLWAATCILLMWPQGFAAPLASSSLSWIPGITLLNDERTATIGALGEFIDWAAILYDDTRAVAVVNGATLTASEPEYAFKNESLQRRYFNPSRHIPTGSLMNVSVPYFSAGVKWINATGEKKFQRVGDAAYSDVGQPIGIRVVGATSFVNSEKWSPQGRAPRGPDTFVGTRLISVQTRAVANVIEEGTCPTSLQHFGQLPPVSQHEIRWAGGNDKTADYDCFLLGEVTINAGIYNGRDCKVVSSDKTSQSYATCSKDRYGGDFEEDWLTGLALDFTSEVLKYAVWQNFSQPWISDDLDEYVAGMLALGYHAAWSALMKRFGNYTETLSFRPSEEIVFVSVDKNKLYIWLGMNATLTLSAILVFGASMLTKTKTIRDTAIASLTMDLTDIVHSPMASGLCSAVSLSRQDGKLPRLRWLRGNIEGGNHSDGGHELCSNKVVFAEDDTSVRALDSRQGLLS